MTDVLTIVSLLASIASLVLAVVAIWFSRTAEHEIRANFERTQRTMTDQFQATKDVLAEVDKRAVVIETTVMESQAKLLNTLTTILNETVIPKKVNQGEQATALLIQMLLQDPEKAGKVLDKLTPFMNQDRQEKK